MKGFLKALLWGALGLVAALILQAMRLTEQQILLGLIVLVFFGLGYRIEAAKDRIADLEWRLDEIEQKKFRR